jgi:hypothetical protein
MGAALFHAAGIPTVNYGPGGAGAHEAVEWVEFVRRARGAKPLLGNGRQHEWRTCFQVSPAASKISPASSISPPSNAAKGLAS